MPGEQPLETLVGILLLIELAGREVTRQVDRQPLADLGAKRLLGSAVVEIHRREG